MRKRRVHFRNISSRRNKNKKKKERKEGGRLGRKEGRTDGQMDGTRGKMRSGSKPHTNIDAHLV